MIDGVRAAAAPELPEGFAQRHSKEAGSDDRAEHFLSKAEYLRLMTQVREVTLSLLGEYSAEQLDAPGPEALRSYAPTIGSVFLMIGSHEIMHSGQIAVVRRSLNKPVVI
jgi:hypothetical protein